MQKPEILSFAILSLFLNRQFQPKVKINTSATFFKNILVITPSQVRGQMFLIDSNGSRSHTDHISMQVHVSTHTHTHTHMGLYSCGQKYQRHNWSLAMSRIITERPTSVYCSCRIHNPLYCYTLRPTKYSLELSRQASLVAQW